MKYHKGRTEMIANKNERSRMWEAAKLLMIGSARDKKFFGCYALYETLKGQFERGELTNDQKRCMGIDVVEIVTQKPNSAKSSGILIEGGI